MTMRDRFDRLVAAYMGGTEAGDAEAIGRLYTEDALLLTPEHPPIRGRKAIQENYKESLGDGFKMTINIQDFQYMGDTAYAAGTYEYEEGTGSWLEVLQRQNDDSLLIHRLCWNNLS